MLPATAPDASFQSPAAELHFKSCHPCSLSPSSSGSEELPGDPQRPRPCPLVHESLSVPGEASFPDTYYDEQDKIDEVVEGVCIHHVVHDLHPAFQSDHLQPGRSRQGESLSQAEPQEGQAAKIEPLTGALLCARMLDTRCLSDRAAIILQVRKPRLREGKAPAQGHTDKQWNLTWSLLSQSSPPFQSTTPRREGWLEGSLGSDSPSGPLSKPQLLSSVWG